MSGKTMLKPLRYLLLPAAALLTGCAQMSGLGDLSLLGTQPATAESSPSTEGSPSAETPVAALGPEETPPVPRRRPGKRPRTPAIATPPAPAGQPAAVAVAVATADAAKPEESSLSLASLGNLNLFSSSDDPDAVLINKPPVEAYSLLAQRIKYCWLNPSTPRLPNHGFHAEVAAGEVREAKMIVYEKAPDGRRGITAFKVDITTESSGALVSAHNLRLSKTDESAFKADLARWAKGDDRCKI